MAYYQCDNCKEIFTKPKKIAIDNVAEDIIDKRKKVDVCPKCDGTFTEILICDDCHDLYLNGYEHNCSKGVEHDK
jgi:uncharacterized protein with PIN domain